MENSQHAGFNDREIGFEHVGNSAFRKGDWKLVKTIPPLGSNKWALYNLKDDPTELHDLSEKEPGIFKEMLQAWQRYRDENGVVEGIKLQLPNMSKH